ALETKSVLNPAPAHSGYPDLTRVPPCYHDLREVFNKTKAMSLPPHRPWDCSIDLLTRSSHSQRRRKQNRYPLPLISSAFELLQQARVFTKLDLRNAYHLLHVHQVLTRLLESKLFVKAEKCEFHASSVSFLGFIVSPSHIKMDPEKWGPEAEGAFQRLKRRFTTAPVLTMPDPKLQFIVEVDAFNEAIKVALEEWRHWLEGAEHPFLVWTDHKHLEYLKSAKRLSSRSSKKQGIEAWARMGFSSFSSHYQCLIIDHGHTFRWTSSCLPPSKGNTVVLTVVDRFSKMTHFIPLPKLPSAKETAQVSTHPAKKFGWPSTKDLQLHVHTRKLAPRFVGPFPVSKVNNPVSIQLKLPRSLQVHPTFHVSKVKPVRKSHLVPPTKPFPPPSKMVEMVDRIYTVKKRLPVRRRGRGRQFLVDWEGYRPEE
ncbi:hypothetical protein L3Q82_016558, partial [Scortum barcoo]